MLYRISIAILLACTGAAQEAKGMQPERSTARDVSDNHRITTQYAYRDGFSGFSVDKNGRVNPFSSDKKSVPVVTAGEISPSSTSNLYVYDTSTGNSRFGLIERADISSKSTIPNSKAPFTAQAAYGDTVSVSSNGPIPYGWGTVYGDQTSYWIVIRYLLGAPYGALQNLNSNFPIPYGWGRISGGYGYGAFKNVNGATYGRQETLDSSFGIPLNWVRTNPGNGGYYGVFMYVDGAPFGAQITADSYFPIPYNWVRVSTGGAGYGQFRNTLGAPSGTQWYVDASWGIPSDWSFVSGGYPMRIARKN